MEKLVCINKMELYLDRDLDDELYSYLEKYCDVPHYALDVNLFEIEVPHWKNFSFFECTGAKGEFITYNHIFNLRSVLKSSLFGSFLPIDSGLSYNVPFCIKNKRELERKDFLNIIAANHMENWLKFFIEYFFETAPEPYYLSGTIELEGFKTKERMTIKIQNNKMFDKYYIKPPFPII